MWVKEHKFPPIDVPTSMQGRTELCSLLINAGANVNLADSLGAVPLHRAAGPGHADVVRVLLAADNIKV